MNIHEAASIVYAGIHLTAQCRECGDEISDNRGGRCYACGQQEIRENDAMCERESRQIEQDWTE